MTEHDLKDLVRFRIRWEQALARNGSRTPDLTAKQRRTLDRWRHGESLRQLAQQLSLLELIGVALVVVQHDKTLHKTP